MNNKTVNVDFVARAIEIDLDGKEHFIAAALAAEQAIKAKEGAELVAPEYDKAKNVLDNIVTYTDTAKAQADIATTKAAEAVVSADIATQKAAEAGAKAEESANSANASKVSAEEAQTAKTSVDATAKQLTDFIATKETLTAPAVDKSLTIEGAAADSKVVGDSLSKVKSKFDDIYIEKNLNYFDADNVTNDGYWDGNNGNLTSNASYSAMNSFVEIEPNVTYSIWRQNKTAWEALTYSPICFYDKDKRFIKGYTLSTTNVCVAPSNALFMRASANTHYLTKTVIVVGDAHPEKLVPFNTKAYFLNEKINVQSLDDVRRKVFPFNFVKSEKIGYLLSNGSFDNDSKFHCSYTDKIKCKQGDRFEYTGKGEFNAVSYLFYAQNDVIGSGQINGTDIVIIPQNVDGVVFASYAEKEEAISLELKALDNLDDKLNYLQKDVETLIRCSEHNPLYGKKWVACGDSYTAGDFNGYVDATGQTGMLSDAYDTTWKQYKTYPWWIAKRNNMELINEAVAGTTMSNGGTNNPFSLSRYKKIPPDADYITIMFGLNECDNIKYPIGTKTDNTNNTIWGAWNIVLEYFLTNVPYAKIGIIIPDGWLTQEIHDTLIEIARYWGVPYLDLKGDDKIPLMTDGRLNGIVLSDKAKKLRNDAFLLANHHPNLKAHQYRSTVVENFLKGL